MNFCLDIYGKKVLMQNSLGEIFGLQPDEPLTTHQICSSFADWNFSSACEKKISGPFVFLSRSTHNFQVIKSELFMFGWSLR